jgi:uncharacterized protein YbjT (DUF2867 family)
MPRTIAVAGATGRLGHLIVAALLKRGATVRALVRPGGPEDKRKGLDGAQIIEVDPTEEAALTKALAGTDVVVSALNGLRDVIVDGQTTLLNAAVAAKVGRFIPSDYAADIMKVPLGENRNFDLRREFRTRLLAAPIKSTSILIGGFMELLLWGRALDAKGHKVTYWGTPDQPLNYTTTPDVAEIAATVALDPEAPPVLRIVGDTVTAQGLAEAASAALGVPFTLERAGSIDELVAMIARERQAHPEAETEIFPRFQQLQYTHNMQSGSGALSPLDNGRYGLKLTSVRQLLAAQLPGMLSR